MTGKLYFYETHLHTMEGSACSHTAAEDFVEAYKNKGYAGIIVTDHFFNGNSAISRDLPWEDRIDAYCEGYERAKKMGDKLDLQVFFGMEVNFYGDEFILLGPDKKWLKKHPEIMEWTCSELYEEIHKIGGAMIQAHPFRDRDYIRNIMVHPETADAFEGYNAGNDDYSDQYAYEYCKQHGIHMTSGTDMHHLSNMDHNLGGIAFTKKLTSIEDLAKRIIEAERVVPLLAMPGTGLEACRASAAAMSITDNEYGFITYANRLVPSIDAPFEHPIIEVNYAGSMQPRTTMDILSWNKGGSL